MKFVVVVDMRGRSISSDYPSGGSEGRGAVGGGGSGYLGLRDGEMKVVFKAIQGAYVRLLQNPFYVPDEHGVGGGKKIGSRRFEGEIRGIGEGWVPGGMGGQG